MMTFVLAAIVLVTALCVATALDGVTPGLSSCGVASHFLAAGLFATECTAPIAPSSVRRAALASADGRRRRVTACGASLTRGLPISD
jgi:hypothetical protein